MTASELMKKHIGTAEKILIEFNIDEEKALIMLDMFKNELSEKVCLANSEKELYEPAVYNALAVINSAPNQKSANRQLVEALVDAKEELKLICELL